MFHLSLIAIVALLAASRLTSVTGRFELTEGMAFDGTLLSSSSGALASPTRATRASSTPASPSSTAPG